MSIINEYMNIENEYKINLDSNEIYMSVDDNILMKLKSCLAKVDLYRYPANDMSEIKRLYGAYCGCSPENIIVGNGSDEAIDLVISTYIRQGKKVLSLNPDFVMYDFYVTRYGGSLLKYNIDLNKKIDINDFIRYGKENKADMIVFSNPNNPTGINFTVDEVKTILKEFSDSVVVIDEAYFEFNKDTVIPYINEYKNLFVTRTLSKAWGLAALRMGFLITCRENIEKVLKFKVPYTVSSYSQNLAEIVLKYPKRVVENAEKIIESRKELFKELKNIEKEAAMNINFYPSKGNFIFGRTNHKEALRNGLIKNGIKIRYFDGDSFRITVGSPMENAKVIETIKNIFVY